MGKRANAHVYEQGTERSPVDIAEWSLGQAKREGRDVLIVDTAGRLAIDTEMMEQARQIIAQRVNAMGVAETEITVLCGHSHGIGTCRPWPNLEIRTGGWPPGVDDYGNPVVQATFEI